MNDDIITKARTRILGIGGIIGAVLIIVLIVWNCLYKIEPGMAGVVYNLDGGLEEETLSQGYHLVMPYKKVTAYPISTETEYLLTSKEGDESRKEDNGIDISTKDGKTVHVSVTYAYHVDQNRLPEVFAKFRGQTIDRIEDTYMKSELLRCINEVTANYSLMDVVGEKRREINEAVQTRFASSLGEFGIIVETLNIADAKPDAQTAEAIQRVIDSQNRLEQAKIDRQTAEIEAERAVTEAEGKRRANELLQQSLTAEVLVNKAIEKWNGVLPQVTGQNILGTIDLKSFLNK